MTRWLTSRRLFVLVGIAAIAALAPFAVLAATGTFGSALDRQAAKWSTTDATTASKSWRDVPGLFRTRCTLNQVTATLSATVRGGPVRFRILIDDAAPMKPGGARFVPNGTESFSFVFVGHTGPFEANDNHGFSVQWRSPSGVPVTMINGALNLLYQQGTQACP